MRLIIEGASSAARREALRAIAAHVRLVYERRLSEIDEVLRDTQRLLVDVQAAQRFEVERAIREGEPRIHDIEYGRPRPDHDQLVWPFDGEYWRDELGTYRQVVSSRCVQG